MNVFVSSTVFDLIDVRAELRDLLVALGAEPVMSDESLSAFEVSPDANSIETCLSNVRQCDDFILILDRRYGPSLKNSGFPDVSATHLEYIEARKHKKRIHFFVRDRLDADYSIWKRNKKNEVKTKFAWVGPKDEPLFSLLADHAALDKDSDTSNWYSTFRSSLDLKLAVERKLRLRNTARVLNHDIRNNRFPFFDYATNSQPLAEFGVSNFKIEASFKNVGTVPAFDVSCHWKGETSTPGVKSILPPGTSIECRQLLADPITLSNGFNSSIILEFKTGTGIEVREEYSYGFEFFRGGTYASGGTLIERTFHPATDPLFELSDLRDGGT